MTKYNISLLTVKEDDHENRDCLVVFVLSDGFENEITCSDGVSYRPDDLWKSFTENLCPTLAGKPKLFFFVVFKTQFWDNENFIA